MGLCASTPVREPDAGAGGAAGGVRRDTANPLMQANALGAKRNTAASTRSSTSSTSSAHGSSKESKAQNVLRNARKRKQVIVNAGDGDDDGGRDGVTALADFAVDKSAADRQWIRDTLGRGFFMFNDLDAPMQEALVDVMSPQDIAASSAPTIRQGDTGDYMYVVQSGAFEVTVDGVTVAELGEGKVFGELALLYDAPRAATVQIKPGADPGRVWRVGRKAFKIAVRGADKNAAASVRETLGQVDLLKDLSETQRALVAEALEPVSFNQGEHIIHQGETGDVFYIVQSGAVVCRDAQGKSADLPLGPGGYFGELAVLTSLPRQRDVIATAEGLTVCLILDREAFQRHLGNLDDIMDVNMRLRTLRCMPMFNSLSDVLAMRLAQAFETETFNAGDTVVSQGDVGDKFFVVQRGELQAFHGDQAVANAQIKVGEFFGEMALLHGDDRAVRSATISVTSDGGASCFSLTRTKFNAVLGAVGADNLRKLIEDKASSRRTALENASVKFEDLKRHGLLGSGTFGTVYLVTDGARAPADPNDLRPMALKCMKKKQIVRSKMTASINNERALMSAVEHPFLLRLITTFQDKDQVYMLLDYVQGGELFSRLAKKGRLSFSHSRFYAACVVSAFEHMHSKQMIYRDLKPENLLLDEFGYLRVVDFGFAKKLAAGKKTYTVCGTPEYLAPEIILNKGHDYGVDHYAVGILVYEMEVGVSPFADQSGNMSSNVICQNILQGRARFPSSLNVRTKKLVQDLLEKSPAKRLGGGARGTSELIDHEYFRELKFDLLVDKRYNAPWKPTLQGMLDFSNFDQYEVQEYDPARDGYSGKQTLFDGF